MNLDTYFWDNRYKKNDIGWDLGEVSPPLKEYFNQLKNKDLKILIPGGGNSYEAEHLFNKGFRNIFIVDLSITALNNFTKRVPNFPQKNLLYSNFFDTHLTFDLIIEQTFFCALNPNLRTHYVSKVYDILNCKGKLVGVLFDTPLNSDTPPFGGNKKEYFDLFSSKFSIKNLEKCYNSIESRDGKELFINLIKT